MNVLREAILSLIHEGRGKGNKGIKHRAKRLSPPAPAAAQKPIKRVVLTVGSLIISLAIALIFYVAVAPALKDRVILLWIILIPLTSLLWRALYKWLTMTLSKIEKGEKV